MTRNLQKKIWCIAIVSSSEDVFKVNTLQCIWVKAKAFLTQVYCCLKFRTMTLQYIYLKRFLSSELPDCQEPWILDLGSQDPPRSLILSPDLVMPSSECLKALCVRWRRRKTGRFMPARKDPSKWFFQIAMSAMSGSMTGGRYVWSGHHAESCNKI